MLLYAAQFALHSFYFVTQRPNDLFHAMANNINFALVIWSVIIGTVVAWSKRRQRTRDATKT